MKVFYNPASPNCRKLIATILSLGIKKDMTFEIMDFAKFPNDPAYLKINPNGAVPSLEDGKLILWDSCAIMQYLADKTPGNKVYPKDPKDRADINRWMFWNAVHFEFYAFTLAWENVFKGMLGAGKPDAHTVEWALAGFRLYAPVLDDQLKSRKFVTGDQVTLADFAIGGVLTYAEPAKMPLKEFKNISAWMERMNSLKEFKAAQEPV